jgi:hypothetical protein
MQEKINVISKTKKKKKSSAIPSLNNSRYVDLFIFFLNSFEFCLFSQPAFYYFLLFFDAQRPSLRSESIFR